LKRNEAKKENFILLVSKTGKYEARRRANESKQTKTIGKFTSFLLDAKNLMLKKRIEAKKLKHIF
jgi:hypothetical protein